MPGRRPVANLELSALNAGGVEQGVLVVERATFGEQMHPRGH
jgi:hypothetical protein